MTRSSNVADGPIAQAGIFDRFARRVLMKRMGRLNRGQITLIDHAETTQLGSQDELQATVKVHHSRFFREAVLGGTNGVAAAYLRGDWDCDNLTNLFRIFVRNLEASDRIDGGLARLAGIGHRFYHWCRANSFAGSRRNIGAHYDLGNEFFQLWLDETLAYSCGIFTSPEATLREASEEKFDRVCRKLQLHSHDHVLEIGTGWGGFAMHAANEYGCRVTTTTISEQQYLVAKARIEQANLTDRVSLLQQDYRLLTGQFDKLVSIEMIEAVGHQYYDEYFRKCSQLLRPDGSLVLQAIVMPERRYQEHLRCVDFIARYIFPGGSLPSIATLLESVGRVSDLRLVHVEDFAPHYAETLRRWRRRFQRRLDEVRQLGYSEQFIRLWNYYLCYCEAVFEERHIGVVQVQFDKPLCRRESIELSTLASSRTRTPSFSWAAPSTPKRETAHAGSTGEVTLVEN